MVYDPGNKILGTIRHFLVTTEQFFKMKHGHFSQFGLLLQMPDFRRRVARFCIDEAHSIYFDGTPLYKRPAFRPAWGRLNEIKILFPSTPFHILTATSPPHVLRVIENAVLRSNYECIHFTCNRANTIYATHCVVDNLDCQVDVSYYVVYSKNLTVVLSRLLGGSSKTFRKQLLRRVASSWSEGKPELNGPIFSKRRFGERAFSRIRLLPKMSTMN